MIGPKAIRKENEVSDPLLFAIGEFREELLFLIDSELARLQEQEHADDALLEQVRAASRESQLSGSRTGLGLHGVSSRFQSGANAQQPRTREMVVDRDPTAETTKPSTAPPERETDPELEPPLSNPRQRLDALARLLDHRLKQTQGTLTASGSAGQAQTSGKEDDVL
jgi:hypothetical protein